MLDFSILTDNWICIWKGLKLQLLSSLDCVSCKFYNWYNYCGNENCTNSTFRWIGTAYVEFIRNIPLVIIAFFFYYWTPTLGFRIVRIYCWNNSINHLYVCFYRRSDTSRNYISSKRANGGGTIFRVNLCSGDAINYFTSSNKNCYSSTWKSIY